MRSKSGFTLVELSIVLVILGLLVGGVLAGQSLIHSAELRAQIRQIQEYELAVNSFKLKYLCLPGDCDNATKFFGATDADGHTVNDGDANGRIDTDDGNCYDNMFPCGTAFWSSSIEMNGVFQQLSLAQLIIFKPSNPAVNGPTGVSLPPLSLKPSAGFFIGASYNLNMSGAGRVPATDTIIKGTNWIYMVACNGLTSHNTIGQWDNGCGIFTPPDTLNMDTKMDDGKPLSGKFIGFSGGNPSPYDDCVNGAGTDYEVSLDTTQCQAAYMLN